MELYFIVIISVVAIIIVLMFLYSTYRENEKEKEIFEKFNAQNLIDTHERFDVWKENWPSKIFLVYQKGYSIATCSYSPLRRTGYIKTPEQTYAITRKGFILPKLVFMSENKQIATAGRINGSTFTYEYRCIDGTFLITKSLSKLAIFTNSEIVGTVDEEEEVIIPKSWSKESKLLLIWLLHILWLQIEREKNGS
jgi:hypothetical protein